MPRLLLATLLIGTLLPTVLSARDEVPQTGKCSIFQSDASNMQPEARNALKEILMTCSSDIAGSQCREAIEVFDLEYGERFSAINRGIRTWSLLEQHANIRRQLDRNYEDDRELIDLLECLKSAQGAREAQSERAEETPFEGHAETGPVHIEKFSQELEDKLTALENSEKRLREVTKNLETQLSALNERTTEIKTRVWWIFVLVVCCAAFAVFLYLKLR
jgi:DNA repair exonuclease SbcCD ATPase subunit